MKATYLTISGNKQLTNFMQCADVFEKTKVLGEIKKMTITFKDDVKLSLKKASMHKYVILEALEQSDQVVSFIHLLQIEDDNKIIKNNNKIDPYVNKTVKVISNGETFFVFANYIKHLNIPVETDEWLNIKKVGNEISNKKSKKQ